MEQKIIPDLLNVIVNIDDPKELFAIGHETSTQGEWDLAAGRQEKGAFGLKFKQN